jgi:hypothetical protein
MKMEKKMENQVNPETEVQEPQEELLEQEKQAELNLDVELKQSELEMELDKWLRDLGKAYILITSRLSETELREMSVWELREKAFSKL